MNTEEHKNIKFVQIIEQHPCLYDYSIPDYSKRDVSDRAWSRVADEAKVSVADCKDKWKNLRTAFSRSQKQLPSGSAVKEKKKYYLSDVMQFIVPFIKSRSQVRNLPDPPSETEFEVEPSECSQAVVEGTKPNQSGVVITSSEEGTENSFEAEQSSNEEPLPFKKPHQTSQKSCRAPNSISDEADKCFIEFVKHQTNNTLHSADHDFLKSLLPDMQKLTDRRNRKFKRLTLELLDNLLVEQEDEVKQQLTPPTPSSAVSWDDSNEMGQTTGGTCVEQQNENCKLISSDSAHPLAMKMQLQGGMVRVESEREENFVKQELRVCVEHTKKPASKECRQHFEYVDVTSIKTETDYYITKEEPGECFEKLGFDMIKEEVEDEVSVQKNEMHLGDMEASSLYDAVSVKQVDTLGDCSDENKTHFCKCEACSKSSKLLTCSRNDSQTQPHECDAGLYTVLQERDNLGMEIHFSQINTQISHISQNKCMEFDRKTHEWLCKREEAQRRKHNEEKSRKLQRKRDSERSRYSQMTDEEKARMLLKKRDAKRNRYSQMAWEEKARILQQNRDAKRYRYRQLTGEEKARILQKKRDAKRNRYSQMTGEEKARILQKNRDAKRHKYSQMTCEEKVRMLQKKKEARQMRLRQKESDKKAKATRKKKAAHHKVLSQMKGKEEAEMPEEKREAQQNRLSQMETKKKAMALENKSDVT